MSPEKIEEQKEREKEREKKCKEEKDREKELYSKESVAHCINFAVGEASNEATHLNVHDRFSCYLATILARDKEVVAVWLRILQNRSEIYLTKNFDWTDEDDKYILEITKYVRTISENAPETKNNIEKIEKAFFRAVMSYCSRKIMSRWNKLMKDISTDGDNKHVKSLIDFFSASEVGDTNRINSISASRTCNEYYKQVKDESGIPPKFLGHIKKVGSYFGSIKGIIDCAHNPRYKPLFSNIRAVKGRPVIIKNQPIYSWKNIIKGFIEDKYVEDEKYKNFMHRCNNKPNVMDRIHEVYTDKATKQLQLDDDIKQHIYLHAEMHILSFIIDNKITSRVFIAVSKKCCYLCGLYIDFAIKQGYNIVISGKHEKIYGGWKLPHVKDNDFKEKSLTYILGNLDRIIMNKLEHYTESLPTDSDSKFTAKFTKDFDNEVQLLDIEYKK